jgi:hypothetical protein
MKSKVKAKLFSFEAFLNRDGNVELLSDAVDVKEFEKTMNTGLPMYEGTYKIAKLIEYLRSNAKEIMDKSGRYL